LLRDALGEDKIPVLATSVRQNTEREREIASLFRHGKIDQALSMKREDGSAVLVEGGREDTIRKVAELWRERTKQHRDVPGFKLTISAPTNADVRDISMAIREELRRGGRLGPDVRTIQAIDRTGEVSEMPLAIGDRVRMFDRVFDVSLTPRKALASNGDTVEVRQLRNDGMVVRNDAGMEGFIAWSKIRSREDGPIRLAYGHAQTVDVAQGGTATEHIHVLPSGSRATQTFKTYVAATRHRTQSWLVFSDTAERQEILDRAMLGQRIEVKEPDMWANIARNLSREPIKPSARSLVSDLEQRQGMRPRA
jgi:hypothetical protein